MLNSHIFMVVKSTSASQLHQNVNTHSQLTKQMPDAILTPDGNVYLGGSFRHRNRNIFILLEVVRVSNPRVPAKANAPYVVGVDLGGTNVRASVLNRDEKQLGRFEVSSDAKAGVARTVKQIGAAVRGAIEDAGVKIEEVGAVGIAVPGHIDVPNGVVVWAPNFGDFADGSYIPYKMVPLRELVEAELGLAMVMDNDANVAALGEFRYGAGRGTNSSHEYDEEVQSHQHYGYAGNQNPNPLPHHGPGRTAGDVHLAGGRRPQLHPQARGQVGGL